MSDSDEEVVVRRPAAKKAPPKKQAADSSSDDDDVVVRRPTNQAQAKPAAKRAATADSSSDSDNDAVVVRKVHTDPNRNKPAADSDSDDDSALIAKRPGAARDNVDSSADPMAGLVDLIDYDTMSEEQFLSLLKKVSRRQRLTEKLRVAEIQREREEQAVKEADEPHVDGEKGYTYNWMLDRCIDKVRAENPDFNPTERAKLPMPKIERAGAKKTALTNFKELCLALNRSQDDVKDFIDKQLTTTSAIDGNDCLIIRIQNVKSSQFETILQKYIIEYVKCALCNKIDTELTRDPTSRLQMLTCRSCKATRYLQSLGAATYAAQTTRRSKRREQQAM